MSDEQILDRKAAELLAVFKEAQQDPPRHMEKRTQYLRRIAKGRDLSPETMFVLEALFTKAKDEQRLQKARNDEIRKGLDGIAKLAERVRRDMPGLSAAQTFVKVVTSPEGSALYSDIRKAGGDPGLVAKAMGDDGGDDTEDGSEGFSPSEAADYYAHSDISDRAANGSRAFDQDGGVDSLMDTQNVGHADADLVQLRRTAHDLEVQSAAAGKPMSRHRAITKSYAINSAAYARLRKNGWDGNLD